MGDVLPVKFHRILTTRENIHCVEEEKKTAGPTHVNHDCNCKREKYRIWMGGQRWLDGNAVRSQQCSR